MTKPTMLLIPKATVPFRSANDYACGTYNGNTNFSCSPYGNLGNIDEGLHKDSGGIDWPSIIIGTIASGLVSVIIGN